MEIKFTWNHEKARKNLQKHGVSFQIAQEVFCDPYLLTQENYFIDNEQRYVAIGRTKNQQLLVVVFIDCSTDEQEHFHLISAREAEDYEQRTYARQF
jgi:uncharacterized protein